MKLWAAAFGVAGIIAATQVPKPAPEYVLFLTGDSQGYLSPCGCSWPMMGGVKRRASVVERLGIKGRTLILENSGLVKSAGRQDEMKLETFAQLHNEFHGTAMNLGLSEAKIGVGVVSSMARLSGDRLVSASLEPSQELGIQQSKIQGPFLVSGVTEQADLVAANLGAKSVQIEKAVAKLLAEAKTSKKKLLLMLDGNRAQATQLAKDHPTIALIQYRQNGKPADQIERVGKVVIASPGDGGKSLVRLVWKNDAFVSYTPVELNPGYKDEPSADRLFRTYLKRVGSEQLLEELQRTETDKFVGSEACIKCHSEAGKVWRNSKHAGALKTLEHEGHDRDPDCVECHVTGLSSTYGFTSRKETPDLAFVGCESCHGAGAKHSASPKEFLMGKVGANSCASCHRVENSPRFDFSTYWEKIRHK